jgi:cell division protein FtsB
LPGVTGVPGVPSAEELAALPASELAVRLAEAYRLIAELTAQAGRMTAQVERLSARVEELERQARKDSSTSSRPIQQAASGQSRGICNA